MGSQTNVPIWCGWQTMTPDLWIVNQAFRVERDLLQFFQPWSPQVVSKVNGSRPLTGTSRIMILYDNASSHKAGAVIATLLHPAYSPDLKPCDFLLFPKLKELLAGNKYTHAQDLSKAVNSELRGIPKEEYRTALDKWRRRLQMCV